MNTPRYSHMPNTLLLLACGPAEWRRLMEAADDGGSPLWIEWLRETYFASAAWRNKREQRLQHDGGKCCRCGCMASRSSLEVYHTSFASLGDEDVAADLETRCRACHAEAQIEGKLDKVVADPAMLRSMKESLKLFTRDTEKNSVHRAAIAMLG